jgi:hypothetical protein
VSVAALTSESHPAQNEENAEQAIFAVYCMLGDWLLADYWLSQHRKLINFDFQLFNYCESIDQVNTSCAFVVSLTRTSGSGICRKATTRSARA